MNQSKEVVYVIGHKNPDTDSVVAALGYTDYLQQRGSLPGVEIAPARAGELNNETVYALSYFKTTSPPLLENAAGCKLILVDHAEKSQMVDGAEKSEILGVLDHHRATLNHQNPIFFHTEAVGSTSTLVAEKYFRDEHLGVRLSTRMAGLLLAGILSDTVVFRSSTTTAKDKELAKKLATVAGVFDLERLGTSLKKAGVVVAGGLEDLVTSDFKDWELFGKKIGVSQIETADLLPILAKRGELKDVLSKIYCRGDYYLAVLMLTDIIKIGTQIIAVGNTRELCQAFNNGIITDEFYVAGMISRKKDFIPLLTKALAP